MGWTILNLVCFAIGAYLSKATIKETMNGKGLVIGNIMVALAFSLGNEFPLGITFLVTSIITVFVGVIFFEPTDPNGYRLGDAQKAFDAQQIAKAKANPTLAMLDSINLNMLNNSNTSTSFRAQQQKESDEWTQERINTIGDINAGRAPNGTNGVWLKD